MLQRPVEPAQYTSLAFPEALLEAGLNGSIRTVRDALDNDLIEFDDRAVQVGGLRRKTPPSHTLGRPHMPSLGSPRPRPIPSALRRAEPGVNYSRSSPVLILHDSEREGHPT